MGFDYSDKYTDGDFEYRHVQIPRELGRKVPKSRCLTDKEWRDMGIQQSLGWVHYAIHRPEPHVLMFKRPLGTDGTGRVDPALRAAQQEKYLSELYGKVDPAHWDALQERLRQLQAAELHVQ